MKKFLRKEKIGKLTLFSLIMFVLAKGIVYAATALASASVLYNNSTSGLSSVDVQAALAELASKAIKCDSLPSTSNVGNCANVAAPKLTGGLIPVTIADNGTVTYANTSSKWYDYCNKKWANAVILISSPSKTYSVGNTISEADIESYFVWIPKYKYKLWNIDTETGALYAEHTIDVVFDTTNTTDTSTSCASPLTSGSSGNCSNGKYMTHPTFITMNVNGFWIGKFETGYKGSTSSTLVPGGNVYNSDSTKVQIKPNVFAWRNNDATKVFDAAYNYKRTTLDSHLTKNTEWGAVAYLSQSSFGIAHSININNSTDFYTGKGANFGKADSQNDYSSYNTKVGYLASTTGNIYGVYDMAGGSTEALAASFSTTYQNNRYYDFYVSSASYNPGYRILGDATLELGPLNTYPANTRDRANNTYLWYQDLYYFYSQAPLMCRGGSATLGINAGIFSMNNSSTSFGIQGFRISLTPAN